MRACGNPGEGWEGAKVHRVMGEGRGGCQDLGSLRKDLGPPREHRDLEVREGHRHLELNAGFGYRAEGIGLPVRLLHLLPHNHIKAGAVLVAKDEARIVVICDRVHVERAFEVHAIEGRIAWGEGGEQDVSPTPTGALPPPPPHLWGLTCLLGPDPHPQTRPFPTRRGQP